MGSWYERRRRMTVFPAVCANRQAAQPSLKLTALRRILCWISRWLGILGSLRALRILRSAFFCVAGRTFSGRKYAFGLSHRIPFSRTCEPRSALSAPQEPSTDAFRSARTISDAN